MPKYKKAPKQYIRHFSYFLMKGIQNKITEGFIHGKIICI